MRLTGTRPSLTYDPESRWAAGDPSPIRQPLAKTLALLSGVTAEGRELHLVFVVFFLWGGGETPSSACHVRYLQALIAGICHDVFSVHKKI